MISAPNLQGTSEHTAWRKGFAKSVMEMLRCADRSSRRRL